MTVATAHSLVLALLLATGSAIAALSGRLRDWAGEYQGGAALSLGRDGRIVLRQTCFDGAGDVTRQSESIGMARLEGQSLFLSFDGQAPPDLRNCPRRDGQPNRSTLRLTVANVSGSRFLLDEWMLKQIVNDLNASTPTPVETWGVLRKVAKPQMLRQSEPVPALALLPAVYKKLLLASPLAGKVIHVSTATSREINVGGWMREPKMAIQNTATVTIDLGESQGVFPGMRLYIDRRGVVLVERVLADRCEVTMRWLEEALRPNVGAAVSSKHTTAPNH
jgi:hypothetical protein